MTAGYYKVIIPDVKLCTLRERKDRLHMAQRKPDIITFKVADSLLGAMRGIPNRSEFIRTAILSALDSVCPLCKGSGILTPNQKKHWTDLAPNHFVE